MNNNFYTFLHVQFYVRSAASWLFHARWLFSLRYLQPKDGLPDTRGALSLPVPSQAIAEANRAIQATIKAKRGAYKRYSANAHAEIGRYASHHGVAAAARYFSKKLDSHFVMPHLSFAFCGSLSHISTCPTAADKCDSHEHTKLFRTRPSCLRT